MELTQSQTSESGEVKMDKEDKRRIIDKLATSLAGDIEVLADEHQMTCYGLFQEIWSELGDEVLNWCEQLDSKSP